MYKLKWFESGIWCDKREGEGTKAVQVRDGKELARKKKLKKRKLKEGDKEKQEYVSCKRWKRNLLHDDGKGKGIKQEKGKRVKRDRYIISGK